MRHIGNETTLEILDRSHAFSRTIRVFYIKLITISAI